MVPQHAMDSLAHCILVVEDDVLLARAIARELAPSSERMLVAHTLEKARALLDEAPDLITLDIELGDESGLELARLAAQRRPCPQIVAMTGKATPEDAFELASLGVRAMLSKPFDLDSLCSTVQSMLQSPRELDTFFAAEVGRASIHEVQSKMRKTMVEQALALAHGNLTQAAKTLQLSRQGLQRITRELEIDIESFRKGEP